jgi:hypothetical protein
MRMITATVLIGLSLLIGGIGVGAATAEPTPTQAIEPLDLTIAIEWELGAADQLAAIAATPCPAPALSYLDQLEQGLRETAAYLYYASEGQLRLGRITVTSADAKAADADIVILASNAYRPTAYVGGAVTAPTAYVRAGESEPQVVFYPAPVLLGRLWDGRGARCGAWSDPAGWRTIGHELGHHVLRLYDRYFRASDGAPQYCSSSGLSFRRAVTDFLAEDTLMAYHYSADRFWRGGVTAVPDPGGRALACADTHHELVYGEGTSEWDVLREQGFSDTARLPAAVSGDRAELLRLATLDFSFERPRERPGSTVAPVQIGALPEGASDLAFAEAYLLRMGPNDLPERVIGQGLAVPGEAAALPFLGVQPGDYAAIYVYDAASGDHYHTSRSAVNALTPAVQTNVTPAPSPWQPVITVTPDVLTEGAFSRVAALRIEVEDCARVATQVQVAYCPLGGNCNPPVISESLGGSRFHHTFRFDSGPPPTQYGYIYTREIGATGGAERVVWYQIGGGVGPATGDFHAPLVDGLLNTDAERIPDRPATERETRLLFSPTPVCTVAPTLPEGIHGIIGSAYSIQPVIAGPNQSRPWGAPPAQGNAPDPGLRLRLFYNEDLLDLLGVQEQELTLVQRTPNGAWEELAIAAQSRDLDWVISAPQQFAGDGAYIALAVREPRLFIPLMAR